MDVDPPIPAQVMNQDADSQADRLPIAGSGISRLDAARWLLVVLGVGAVATAAKLLPLFFDDRGLWILRGLLSVAVICLVGAMAVRHYRQWVVPREQMRELVREIRRGRASIEEFSQLQGRGLQSLGEEIKAVLHELKLQRQAVTELNAEVHKRIANRTSALERTIASLRNQASRDGLTGLYNRRMLDDLLQQFVAQCDTDKKPLAMLMLDMDFFKELNDTRGHAAGDELLRSVGQIISSTIRDGDVAFRYGGDEFVILLPSCDAAPAQRVGERLQSLVQSLTSTYKMVRKPGLSIGVATLAELTEPTAANLIRLADRRMYEFKATRRSVAAAKRE